MSNWRQVPRSPLFISSTKKNNKILIQFTSENCFSRIRVTLVLIFIIPAFWNPVAPSTQDSDFCSIWYYSKIVTTNVCITNSFWHVVVILTLADEVSRLIHKIFSFVFLKTTLLVFCHILTSRLVKINALWVRNFVTSSAVVYTFSCLGTMEPFPIYGWKRILLIMNAFYLKSSHELKGILQLTYQYFFGRQGFYMCMCLYMVSGFLFHWCLLLSCLPPYCGHSYQCNQDH